MSLSDGWLVPALKILATAAVAAGAGGLGVHQFDEGAPARAERELEELRLESDERAAMRERCDRMLELTQAECRHMVERCSSLVTGGD